MLAKGHWCKQVLLGAGGCQLKLVCLHHGLNLQGQKDSRANYLTLRTETHTVTAIACAVPLLLLRMLLLCSELLMHLHKLNMACCSCMCSPQRQLVPHLVILLSPNDACVEVVAMAACAQETVYTPESLGGVIAAVLRYADTTRYAAIVRQPPGR